MDAEKPAVIGGQRATPHGLARVIELGGDTDTNGAVAGAMLGARFGLQAIPARWRHSVAEIRTGQTPLRDYADRLVEAADEDKTTGTGESR